MEKLYLIMDKFLEVEYRQKALLAVLRTLEGSYSEDDQEDIKLLISTCKWALEAHQEQIKAGIAELDCYIATAAGKDR